MKPATPPIPVPGDTPFQEMDNMFRAVIQVPKAVIDKREEKCQREQQRKRKKAAEAL